MSDEKMTKDELLEELAETNAEIDNMIEEVTREGVIEPTVVETTEDVIEEREEEIEAEEPEAVEEASEEPANDVEARANALISKKETLIEMIKTNESLAEERKAKMDEIAKGGGKIINSLVEREEKMTNKEIRNTSEYINAFANYVKTGDATECRALLTTNADDGVVPVPEIVEGYIRTAWENSGIMSRVDKSYIRGNLKVGYEVSATDAAVHVEGDDTPIAEEELVIGTVELIPRSLKKWISISDEALDLGGEEFLAYIYDEIAQKIAKLADDVAVYEIVNSPTTPGTAPVVLQVPSEVNATAIIQALGALSDEATNPVVILNKATWAAFKSITTSDGYLLADPFAGMDVIFNNSLSSYDEAEEGEPYVIVGDLGTGIKANFPNGDEIKFKFDDLSLAEQDLVKIVGRMFVAIGVVAPYRFATIVKPVESE